MCFGERRRHNGPVRELVYRSDAKLRQFVVDRPSWFKGAKAELSLGFPAGVGVKIRSADENAGGDGVPDLERVITALVRSDRAPRWFEDDSVAAGEWVHFEHHMDYALLNDFGAPDAVVFVNSADDGPATGLLLHGDAGNLVHTGAVSPAPARIGPSHLYRLLAYLQDAADGVDLSTSSGLLSMARLLRSRRLRGTAAWFGGFARVSAVVDADGERLVVASPLFVEYVPQPD
jgi:hypothetical protein